MPCLTTAGSGGAATIPEAAFPYDDLVKTNLGRGGSDPEYELLDTNAFGAGYWICEVAYAQAHFDDIVMRITVTNASDTAAHLHVLPTLWFPNTWSWDLAAPAKPELRLDANRVIAEHPTLGRYALEPRDASDGTGPAWLFCENETNAARFKPPGEATSRYPKDAIHNHILGGDMRTNPDNRGTKAAGW